MTANPFPQFPTAPLLFPYPSPIHPLPRLSKTLAPNGQSSPTLYLKRDDLSSPLSPGGNKLRKLTYILPAALASGSTHLITVGGVQSNHARQTASAAAQAGLGCVVIPSARVPAEIGTKAAYRDGGNVQLVNLLGAKVAPTVEDWGAVRAEARSEVGRSFEGSASDAGVESGALADAAARPFPENVARVARVLRGHETLLAEWKAAFLNQEQRAVDAAMEDVRRGGGVPYYIPSGGSAHELGGLGYAAWALEVAEQEKQMGRRFDTIVCASASGSTLGGMVAGFQWLEGKETNMKKRRVIGVMSVTTPKESFEKLVIDIAARTLRLISGRNQETDENPIQSNMFELWDSFHGGAYGNCDEGTQEMVREVARTEGVLLDPVYTGKAMTGLLKTARAGGLRDAENILFAHTGGQAALSAYPELR